MTPTNLWDIVNGLAVSILAVITLWYAISTSRMLSRLRKQADAAERQAQTAERTLSHLLEMSRQQRAAALALVRSTVGASQDTVAHWLQLNLADLAASHLLPSPALVPDLASAAVQHASLFAPEAAVPLSRAFATLRICEGEIRTFEGAVSRRANWPEELSTITNRLEAASKHLDLAAQQLPPELPT